MALGFPEDYFKNANDPTQPDCLTQLRLIHYPPSENAEGTWRAGSHTDIGCLTLLFQRDGKTVLRFAPGVRVIPVLPWVMCLHLSQLRRSPIVVNIGDMLSKDSPKPVYCAICDTLLTDSFPVAWSDDRLKSNFHRVRAKDVGKSPSRYSIAYFQPRATRLCTAGSYKSSKSCSSVPRLL